MKLGGTGRAIKKMTHNDNGPGPGRNYRETASFTFCRNVDHGPKIRLKKQLKSAKRLIFIWEMGPFLFAQFFPVLATKWFEPRSELSFLGPKNSVFGPKIRFLP